MSQAHATPRRAAEAPQAPRARRDGLARRALLAAAASAALLLGAALPATAFAGILDPEASSKPSGSLIEPEHRRGAEQTFLTFPEWYLVHSPAELAELAATRPAHEFPFLGHAGQLWSSYWAVMGEQRRAGLDLNFGYHVMIIVLATSTTVEYAIRWVMENTLGRISWVLGGRELTDEDKLAARVDQRYVDFIRQEPWYLFDFNGAQRELWSQPAFGPGLVRKWERRFTVGSEYAAKAAYGWLIMKATRAAYEPALMETRVVVDKLPEGGLDAPELKGLRVALVRELPGGQLELSLPRYFDFRRAAAALAERGADLVDVAGNEGDILLTAWLPHEAPAPEGSRVLFRQPVSTHPGTDRVGLVMPVKALSPFLREAQRQGLNVEHVHDY